MSTELKNICREIGDIGTARSRAKRRLEGTRTQLEIHVGQQTHKMKRLSDKIAGQGVKLDELQAERKRLEEKGSGS